MGEGFRLDKSLNLPGTEGQSRKSPHPAAPPSGGAVPGGRPSRDPGRGRFRLELGAEVNLVEQP